MPFPKNTDTTITSMAFSEVLDEYKRQRRKVRIQIMRDGEIWGLAFSDKDGDGTRISQRKGSGQWHIVSTLICDFSLIELSAYELEES